MSTKKAEKKKKKAPIAPQVPQRDAFGRFLPRAAAAAAAPSKKKEAAKKPKKPKKPAPPARDPFGRYLPRTPSPTRPTPRPQTAPVPRRDPRGRFLPRPAPEQQERQGPLVPKKKPSARVALAMGASVADDLRPACQGIARDIGGGTSRVHLYDSGEVSAHIYDRGLDDEACADTDDFLNIVASALARMADALRKWLVPLSFYDDLGCKLVLVLRKDESVPMLEEFDNDDDEHEARQQDDLPMTGSDLDRSRRGAGGELYVEAETAHFFGDVDAPVNILRTEILGRLADYIDRTFDLDAALEQGTFPYEPYSLQALLSYSPMGQRMLRRKARTWR